MMNGTNAKEYLLSITNKYRAPKEEVELTKNQLKAYIIEKQKLQERGEWND